MQRVFLANPYRPGALGSFGNAKYMLLRQYQFPDEYDERLDTHLRVDHNLLFQEEPERVIQCFRIYTEGDERSFNSWLRSAKDSAIILFLKDITKADLRVNWTGYRVTGTVHYNSAFPVLTLELFAKHPKSKTKVYSEDDAPNVSNPASVHTPSRTFRVART